MNRIYSEQVCFNSSIISITLLMHINVNAKQFDFGLYMYQLTSIIFRNKLVNALVVRELSHSELCIFHHRWKELHYRRTALIALASFQDLGLQMLVLTFYLWCPRKPRSCQEGVDP